MTWWHSRSVLAGHRRNASQALRTLSRKNHEAQTLFGEIWSQILILSFDFPLRFCPPPGLHTYCANLTKIGRPVFDKKQSRLYVKPFAVHVVGLQQTNNMDCGVSTVRRRIRRVSWMCYIDVQGDSHRFKCFLPLVEYQLDDTSPTGKVSITLLYKNLKIFLFSS